MSGFNGELLRERRETLGLTLYDVHDRIRVPVVYLAAFENNELQRLPVSAYSVGFLQSYCQALSLDPEPFVDRYRFCLHAAGADMRGGGMCRWVVQFFDGAQKRPRWIDEAIAWSAISLILLLGWVVYATVTHPFAEKAGARVDAGTKRQVVVTPFDVEHSDQKPR